MTHIQGKVMFKRLGRLLRRRYPDPKTGGSIRTGPHGSIELDTLDGYRYLIFGPDLSYYRGYAQEEPSDVAVLHLPSREPPWSWLETPARGGSPSSSATNQDSS